MPASGQIKKDSKKSSSFKRNAVIVVAVVLLFVGYDVLIGGNIRFYGKWAECGQRPVGANMEWSFGGGTPPNYGTPQTWSLMRLHPEYFCTPLEAEKAGYSASSYQYEFPHLKEENRE